MTKRVFHPLYSIAKITLVAATLFTMAAWAPAQAAVPDIAGTWQGTINLGMEIRAIVKISSVGHGGYTAIVYGIDLEGDPLQANSVALKGNTVKWSVSGGGSFEGELSDDGKTIEGKWKIYGPLSLVTLARSTPETAWKIPVPPSPQSPMATTTQFIFESVTIKPSKPGDFMSLGGQFDRWSATGATVWQLIFNAFNVYGVTSISKSYQVTGLPNWARSDQFDIQAKMDEDTYAALQKLPPLEQAWQRDLMLQALLADRFKLRIRHEVKQLPVYELVIAKNGFKLNPSQSTNGGGSMGSNRMNFSASPMSRFAFSLSGTVDRIVIDKTGLKGRYDITLAWARDGDPDETAPSIFTALEEQLGLKLIPATGPVDTYVVDHVEEPSAN